MKVSRYYLDPKARAMLKAHAKRIRAELAAKRELREARNAPDGLAPQAIEHTEAA